MLSFDRSESRADQRTRAPGHAAEPAGAARDPAACQQRQRPNRHGLSLHEPWDRWSAEALTRLYESEEGRLSRPATGDRIRPAVAASKPEPAAAGAPEPVDRSWLETHLSQLVERLQASLAQASPEPSIAALNDRLEAIEQRFGATLGRVAQRADLDGLRSIEAHVLELGARLEQARERLDHIGAVDEQLRALARKLDDTGEPRAGALERLLRDCIAEWREGEQRTAGTLRNIEDALARLGEAVDAMEASRPAPELTVPPLGGTALGLAVGAGVGPLFHADAEQTPSSQHYPTLLDAADYAPRPLDEQAAVGEAPAEAAGMSGGALEWPSADDADPARSAARLTPGALRIMALRAKLRQPAQPHEEPEPTYAQPLPAQAPSPSAFKSASLSILLMVGAACAAASIFFVYQTFVMPAPASPVTIERAQARQISGVGHPARSGLAPGP